MALKLGTAGSVACTGATSRTSLRQLPRLSFPQLVFLISVSLYLYHSLFLTLFLALLFSLFFFISLVFHSSSLSLFLIKMKIEMLVERRLFKFLQISFSASVFIFFRKNEVRITGRLDEEKRGHTSRVSTRLARGSQMAQVMDARGSDLQVAGHSSTSFPERRV